MWVDISDMRPLRHGDEAQVSWNDGAVSCRVIAAAGSYVLLRPDRDPTEAPAGPCSLTYLDGYVPMGWDGELAPGTAPGEFRFRVTDTGRVADRRNTVRVPVEASVHVDVPGERTREDLDGRIIDVSAGGMRLRRRGQIAKGTPVRVRAELPGGPIIDADAIVRASEPGICSVEYMTLNASTAEDIGAWSVGVLRHALIAA